MTETYSCEVFLSGYASATFELNMVISKTPWRISFFGGGTDLPAWYREHGGAVLSTTIDKYGYITCRFLPPFFEHKNLVVWSHIEKTKSVDEILHPSVRETLKFLNFHDGLGIHFDGDLPARTGLGSSSSFTVGLLNALYALRGQETTKKQLALDAIHIEQNLIRENVGSQDQVAAAFGGLNRITFDKSGEIDVTPIPIKPERLEELQNHLMLVFTGLLRSASSVEGEKIQNMSQRVREFTAMHEMVGEAFGILTDERDRLHDFGKLLHEMWQLKRTLASSVANDHIDGIYEEARQTGAIGGKLLGAGGGGFMLLFAPPEVQPKIRERLKGLMQVPFRFESQGSHIIHQTPHSPYLV